MIETFCALLIAHVLADFLFQTRWIVEQKGRAGALLLHGAIVFVTALAMLGPPAVPALLALATVHIGIDLVKTGSNRKDISAFLLDQAAHLASLLALSLMSPHLWHQSPQAALPEPWPAALLHAGLLISGFIAATRAGGFGIGEFMSSLGVKGPPESFEHGGRIIGLLERSVIFLLIVAKQYEPIGWLLAAKATLRFGTGQWTWAMSEYVIIGTLASFTWAIAVTFAVVALQAALPPLVIPALAP